MKIGLFNKQRKKIKEEFSHREPIMVKMFREKDGEAYKVNISYDDEEGEESTNAEGSDKAGKVYDGPERRKNGKVKFVPNQKYYTISVYAVVTILSVVLIAIAILNIGDVLGFIGRLMRVCAPFIGGGMLALIVVPIVNWLDEALFEKKFKMKKPGARMALSIIITYIVLIGLLTLTIIVLIPQIGKSVMDLAMKSRALYDKIPQWLDALMEKFPSIDFAFIDEKLTNSLQEIAGKIPDILKDSIPKLVSTSYSILKSVINFLLMIAISIYMVADKRRIAKTATKMVYSAMNPLKARGFISTSKECAQIFGGFIIGKTIDSLIIGILCFIILSIFNMQYAILVSVFVGITNMIPFFGPFIGAIPGVLLYLCINPLDALVFAIIILLLQQFDGWFLGPMILGDSTGIRPIWVIFGITVGGAYFHVIGMFLGVPITAVVVFLINKMLDKRLKKKKIEVN